MQPIKFNMGCKSPEAMIQFYCEVYNAKPRYLKVEARRMLEILNYCLDNIDYKSHMGTVHKAEAAITHILTTIQKQNEGNI